MSFRKVSAAQIWLAMSLACAIGVAISFNRFDIRIAEYLFKTSHNFKFLEHYLQSTNIILIEAAVVATLGFAWTFTRRFTRFSMTLGLACTTSIFLYAVNVFILKIIFGVPGPSEVLRGADHTINWFAGSIDSSFPSGHMVLAAGFCGVFMQRYKSAVVPVTSALTFAASLLLLGNWHFLSDVIAGGYIGAFAGFALAGALNGPERRA